MSKKFGAQRKRAFLTYLSQSGNQTLAAERAKVSRSWVQLHRSTDAEFDGACRHAIEEARTLLTGPPPAPPASGRGDRWRYHDGAELVVESVVAGTGGSGGGKRVQVRRARLKQWTPRVEKRFLAVLAATCNVKAACAEVGMWPGSAYNHRHRWPAFARRWEEAVELGYRRIEAALLQAGCNIFSKPDVEPDLTIRDMTAGEALQLLNMHKHAVRGTGGRPGQWPRYPTEEELRQRLEEKMRALRSLPGGGG